MTNPQCEIGMIGLGVMGRNFGLNIRDRGFAVAGYDRDGEARELWGAETGGGIFGAATLPETVSLLRKPRALMMLVPAGPPVDAVIRELLPLLEGGDVIIDGGNSHFKDTELRQKALAEKGILLLGMGVSGGAAGARSGPSLMPGGPAEAYARVRGVFEAVAARVNGEPCAAYLGAGGAGHYVKMVHNGIEYGFLQLIAETYDILKRGMGLNNAELYEVYADWNRSDLNSFLLEITANIFREPDPKTGRPLIDEILDQAKQKGTGRWASEDAMNLQVPLPTIDTAVAMRNLSINKDQRVALHRALDRPLRKITGGREALLERLHGALFTALIVTYAQGMAQLRAASGAYGYGYSLETAARIWRGGCIIRAALLERIRAAFGRNPNLENLLLDPELGPAAAERSEDLRAAVCEAIEAGIPVPALMASLGYLDASRSDWLPANLIQAQRDYFGAHTYERVDEKGRFHTEWIGE